MAATINDPVRTTEIFRRSVTGAVDAEVVDIDVSLASEVGADIYPSARPTTNWTLQAVPDGSQGAGTLSVKARLAGSTTFIEVASMDLSAPSDAKVSGLYEEFQIEASGFDGTDFSFYMAAISN